ncbi:MAG: macro domain-containing protein [Clostridia bacterium]|nr:macro domain-containing protein [Clostridia bacterium]
MSTIEIRKTSITDLDTDAVVNAANDGLWAGSGVCGAIFSAAGYSKLREACLRIGHCDTGSAVITPGFDLKAKYIIHAVGPVYKDGRHGEPELLYSAYYRSLELALENGCGSIGFPLLSAGVFGYPLRGAWSQALSACRDFLDKHSDASLQIVFAVLQDSILKLGREMLRSDTSRYKIAERGDWKALEMPEAHGSFILHRELSPRQTAALRKGNISQGMEDKWFFFMEGDTLFAHRSWTGFCIYRIDFRPDGDHFVTVNRDPEQYSCDSIDEDVKTLNSLLDWWTETPYDHYNEWLSETYDALKKGGE